MNAAKIKMARLNLKQKLTPGLSKKAQYYIFTAVVLLAVLFSLQASIPIQSEKKTRIQKAEDFSALGNSFEKEAAIAINANMYSKENVSHGFEVFINDFYNYAKTKDKGFGMLAVLAYADEDEDWVRIDNHIGQTADIMAASTFTLEDNANTTLPRPGGINITINLAGTQETYSFSTPQDKIIKAQAVMMSVKNTGTRIILIQ